MLTKLHAVLLSLTLGSSLAGCTDGTTAKSKPVSVSRPGEKGVEFYHNFRNKNFSEANFKLVGPDAAGRVKPETEGLRIIVPAGETSSTPVGVTTNFNVHGDFEITAGYEIVAATPPKPGYGVGFDIYLSTSSLAKVSIGFAHVVHGSGRVGYTVGQRMTTDKGNRITLPGSEHPDIPGAGMSGQMRITRKGSQAVLTAAQQGKSEFRHLYTLDLGREDVDFLRFAAAPSAKARGWQSLPGEDAVPPFAAPPGDPALIVDVCLHDVRVRSEGRSEIAVVSTPRSGAALWLLAALFAALLVVGSVWLGWRQRRCEKRGETNASA